MRIKVEQRDIDQGCPGDPEACAVALAVRRATGLGAEDVTVSSRRVLADGRRYLMPPEARQFIRAFDRSEQVAPIEFEAEEVKP